MSVRYTLNKEDGKKILVGLGIACGGALLTYVSDLIPNIDFGEFTPVVVALFSVLINAGRKFLENQK